MCKKLIAFLLAVFILIGCTACSNDADYYVDDDGVRYMVSRDANGEIQVNDSGKLLVFELNENGKRIRSDSGEYLTKYVDFNGQIVTGKFVEVSEMSFTLPNNFTDDRANPGYFRNEAYNGEIFVYYYDESADIAIASLEDSCEGLLESFGSEVYSYEKYTLDVGGTECTAFEQLCTSSEYYQNAFSYILPYDSGYYRFDCKDYKNKVDFDKFIESVELKK